MSFTKLIQEARRVDINTPRRHGTNGADYLRAFYKEFGTDSWKASNQTVKDIKTAFGIDGEGHRHFLVKNGYFEKVGAQFKISQMGLNWISKNQGGTGPYGSGEEVKADDEFGDIEGGDLAKGQKDMTKMQSKKFIVPKPGNNSRYFQQMKKILIHMDGFASKRVKTNYMLAGDPGTGKTSFIKSLSDLLGIPLVVIEAPHITQEHLINIPFVVIDGDKKEQGNITVDSDVDNLDDINKSKNMKVVQAESNLVTRLNKTVKKTPQQIQRVIDKNKVLRDIQPKLQTGIDLVAPRYKAILFLDEFYRAASMKIRNVLRNILNGRIGNDRIPEGVYIIMATNIDDEGTEDIPLNQDFHLMNYDISSKEDFMAFMYSKYIDNPDDYAEIETDEEGEIVKEGTVSGVSVKPEVWNKFMDRLSDEDLGFNDDEVDVRLSPRRLEQFIISVDALLPVKDDREAALLYAFVKTNLSDYLTEKASKPLLDKFNGIIEELIKETSPEINVEKVKEQPVKKSEWRDQLQTQIELKIALGDNRKYVPVVSGAPGIGKTTQMGDMSEKLGMGFIHIDCSNLTTEQITGMPIPDRSGGDEKITTDFSDPSLYITIMQEYEEQKKLFHVEGRKYNIILLLDELNRASVPVFNAIRKVLLEKSFEQVELPDDIIITGAINPQDGESTVEFTGHTKDVLDIIPSGGNFTETFAYIRNKKETKALSDTMGFDLLGACANVLEQLSLTFQSDTYPDGGPIEDTNTRPFWWQDGYNKFYVSPREMTECVANMVEQIAGEFRFAGWDPTQAYTEEEFDAFINDALNVAAQTVMDSNAMTTLKQGVKKFSVKLGMAITSQDIYRKMFDGIKTKVNPNVQTLVQILESAGGDIGIFDPLSVGSYMVDFTSNSFQHDVTEIIDGYMGSSSGNKLLNNIIKLSNKFVKIFDRLDDNGSYADELNKYKDQLKKNVNGKIASILMSDDVDLLDILEDNVLMKKIESLI